MKITVITPPCMHCHETSELEVDRCGYDLLKSGTLLIQDAFPELSLDQRELLITGTHSECWDEMFGDDDEGDYDLDWEGCEEYSDDDEESDLYETYCE